MFPHIYMLAHCKHDFQGNTMMVYAILRQAEAEGGFSWSAMGD